MHHSSGEDISDVALAIQDFEEAMEGRYKVIQHKNNDLILEVII